MQTGAESCSTDPCKWCFRWIGRVNSLNTQWRSNLLESKSAGEEPADCEPSANGATLSRAHRKPNIPLGCNPRGRGQPLRRAPRRALRTHTAGESQGQGSKGKSCTRSRKHNPQGKTEQAGASQYRQGWLNRGTTAAVFKLRPKVLFQREGD